MTGWRGAAADLILGAYCPGCGSPDVPVCRQCAAATLPRPELIRESPEPVAAAGDYSHLLRRLILTWKERGRHGLTHVLSVHLAAAVAELGVEPPWILVPVPTSARSKRQRGADLTRDLAEASARRLNAIGAPTSVWCGLVLQRRTVDQAGLNAAERARNVASTQVARRPRITGPVVIVDDVWTTGATTAESVRALARVSIETAGIAVVARTPLQHERST